MLDFHLDAVSFDHLYQFLLIPFIPGGILVGGYVILRPETASALQAFSAFNPYVRLGIMAIVAYLVGWVFYVSSIVATGVATGIFSLLCSKCTFVRNNMELSQRTNWRKVASQFLGPELTPVLSPVPKIEGPEQVGSAFRKNFDEALKNNAEWKEWYDVLQDYLLRDVPLISNDAMNLLITIEAVGWAFICLLVKIPHARHWEIYVLAAAFVLVGVLAPVGTALGYLTSDRLTHWNFTARLLAETRGLEKHTAGLTISSLRKPSTNN